MKSSMAKCFFKEMCWKKVYQEHNRESEKGNHKCLEDIMRSWGKAFFDKGSFSKESEFTGMCIGKLSGKI